MGTTRSTVGAVGAARRSTSPLPALGACLDALLIDPHRVYARYGDTHSVQMDNTKKHQKRETGRRGRRSNTARETRVGIDGESELQKLRHGAHWVGERK